MAVRIRDFSSIKLVLLMGLKVAALLLTSHEEVSAGKQLHIGSHNSIIQRMVGQLGGKQESFY